MLKDKGNDVNVKVNEPESGGSKEDQGGMKMVGAAIVTVVVDNDILIIVES